MLYNCVQTFYVYEIVAKAVIIAIILQSID